MSFSAPDEKDAIIEAELAEPPLLARPWGFWMTLLWLLAGYVVLTVTQTIGALPVVLLRMAGRPRPQPEVLFAELVADGLLLAVSTLVCAPAMVAFAVGVVKLTRLPLRDYLGLTSPSPRAVSVSLVAIVAFIAAVDSTYLLMGRPIVPDFMLRAYRTAEFLPALLLALVVAAPVWEEIFFRGLLWRGWAFSPLGPLGATLLASLCWTVLHVQYEWLDLAVIFLGGVLLGMIRWRTGSVLLTIALHAVQNLVGFIEAFVAVELLGK